MKKEKIKTIDVTPTWKGLYPLFENFIMNGTQKQRAYTCQELKRLCTIADKVNKERKG